jgi:hypothetical protein
MPAEVVVAVEDAKKHGRTTTGVSTTVDTFQDPSLAEVLNSSAALLVTATRLNAIVTTENTFVTWNVFSVDREIGPQTRRPAECFNPPPPSLRLASREIAVGLLGGVKVVDGVTVTWGSLDRDLALEPGGKYLLLGVRCSDHEVLTRPSGYGFAAIGASGQLGPLASQSPSTYPRFFKELMALGTVDALAGRVRDRKN